LLYEKTFLTTDNGNALTPIILILIIQYFLPELTFQDSL